MKKLLKIFVMIAVIGCQYYPGQAQKINETINKSLPSTKVLLVDNINGAVHIKGSSSNKFELSANKTITGDSKKKAKQGAQETSLAMFSRNDTSIVHIKNPYMMYKSRSKNGRPNFGGYRWDNGDQKETGYNFKFDITVKVPQNTHLIVRTINNGDISVSNIKGEIIANNVNGAIALDQVTGKTKARTINGQLKANYTQVPAQGSSYYTLNGNIKINYPKNLSAELRFKSFNGEFYTDYPVEYLPASVVKKTVRNGKKKIYKIDKYTAVKVGKGGEIFRFETFNGNIYIHQQK
jgi:hypothetical protein